MNGVTCPTCNGKNTIRYGRYRWKQIYYCKYCKKKFTNRGLNNKTYSLRVITSAITSYNLGNTLEESAKSINRRFKVRISKSSVHSWVKEFSNICTYWKIRPRAVKNYNGKILFTHSFNHNGLTYNFRYHKLKLEILTSNYPSLIEYLKGLKAKCPDDIFRENERCSQLPIKIKTRKEGRYNHACKLAELSLKACNNNKERHPVVENFMLINDSSTIACEVPVWFWEKNLDLGMSGHINLLQIRNNRIYVMDFKPGAKREKDIKVASQLFYMHLACPSGPVFHWTGLDAHGSMILSTTSSIQRMPRSDFHVQSGDQIRKRKQLHFGRLNNQILENFKGFRVWTGMD